MAFDHSLTYRTFKVAHLPHRHRLAGIEREVRRLKLEPGGTYADFGCSNGYITDRIRQIIGCREAWGFDHSEAQLGNASASYPAIRFHKIDLNSPITTPNFDFVTCFETLEHVGNPNAALNNLLGAVKPGGKALITVPIEIGWRGLVKFGLKLVFGYDLKELPQSPDLFRRYVAALCTGDRLTQFRDPRQGWGTHFGFDYRDVDDKLRRSGIQWRAWNSGTTRFYRIQGS
jgi:2-polyprenyl-3-methyl-5-hydroxy-6-metoxy-1,4-benzoquinol methylase